MLIVPGLAVLLVAVVAGVAVVAADIDQMRLAAGDFEVFGHPFSPSVGEVFGSGIGIGAVGMLGLLLLMIGVWRTAHRGSEARRELRRSRREIAAARRATPAPQVTQDTAAPRSGPVWSANRFIKRPTRGTESAKA